jgi:hypothetical protein
VVFGSCKEEREWTTVLLTKQVAVWESDLGDVEVGVGVGVVVVHGTRERVLVWLGQDGGQDKAEERGLLYREGRDVVIKNVEGISKTRISKQINQVTKEGRTERS